MNDDYTTNGTDAIKSSKTSKKDANYSKSIRSKKIVLMLLKIVIIMLTLPLIGLIIYKNHEWIMENAIIIGSVANGIILGSFICYMYYQAEVLYDSFLNKKNKLLIVILLLITAYMIFLFNLNFIIILLLSFGLAFIGILIIAMSLDFS